MKKISLFAILLISALLLQECKKDIYTATASAPFSLIATINDTTWATDTVTAVLTYSAALHSKTFECTGTASNKRVYFSVYQNGQTNTSSFPIAEYTNSTKSDSMSYLINTKNPLGIYNYVTQGSVTPGSGIVNITAIDSVKNLITGTFSFTSTTVTYDANKQIKSVHADQVQNGGFTNLPFKFITK